MQGRSVQQHARVIDAIRAGDEEAAASAMASHIRDTATAIYVN